MLEWVCSQWPRLTKVWVINFCETESPFESWLITVGVRRSFPPIDIRLISRSFVASFHICCLLSQRQHKEKAEVPNVFLLRGNRRRSRYIRKEKTTITDIQRWAKMKRELQFGWGTLIWFKISWFLMSLFFVLEIHDKEDHPLFWQVVPIYDHPATRRQQK